jgi:hypothetical protein
LGTEVISRGDFYESVSIQFDTVAGEQPEPEPEVVAEGQCGDDNAGIAAYFADENQDYQFVNCDLAVARLGGCDEELAIFDDQGANHTGLISVLCPVACYSCPYDGTVVKRLHYLLVRAFHATPRTQHNTNNLHGDLCCGHIG